jgi:NAD(P)-dependent dehydrogenase (short-subunit alcohol dehydrogenase family)
MRTLIIGASGGIGAALMQAAMDAGTAPDQIIGLSRRDDGLDVTDEASIERALAKLSGPFERIICATGALEIAGRGPEKSLRAVTPDALADQFAVNATGPILVLKHALRLMPRDRPARFAALSARVGSIGDNRLGGWYSYRAAKAALNQLLRSASVEIARTHPHAVIAALHPLTVATPFTAAFQATHPTVTPAHAAAGLIRVLDALSPAQTGGFFDANGKEIIW